MSGKFVRDVDSEQLPVALCIDDKSWCGGFFDHPCERDIGTSVVFAALAADIAVHASEPHFVQPSLTGSDGISDQLAGSSGPRTARTNAANPCLALPSHAVTHLRGADG